MERERSKTVAPALEHPALLPPPLPGILNRLCTAIDVQIGNVVSLVVLPKGEENQLGPLTKSAMQVGLNVFSSTAILSRDKSVLGTFQLYCCDQRRPTRRS